MMSRRLWYRYKVRGYLIYDGAGSDTFTALGDEHGLFIIVKRGRIWFPDTGIPAELVPLKVAVSVDGGATIILSELGIYIPDFVV